jgi:hypothetical protein
MTTLKTSLKKRKRKKKKRSPRNVLLAELPLAHVAPKHRPRLLVVAESARLRDLLMTSPNLRNKRLLPSLSALFLSPRSPSPTPTFLLSILILSSKLLATLTLLTAATSARANKSFGKCASLHRFSPSNVF